MGSSLGVAVNDIEIYIYIYIYIYMVRERRFLLTRRLLLGIGFRVGLSAHSQRGAHGCGFGLRSRSWGGTQGVVSCKHLLIITWGEIFVWD